MATHAAHQLWRHVPDGQVFVVTLQHHKVVAAAGPLHFTEWHTALLGDFDSDAQVLAGILGDASRSYTAVPKPEIEACQCDHGA